MEFSLYQPKSRNDENPSRYIQPLMWVFLAQLIPQTISMFTVSDRGFDIVHGVLINGALPMNPETTMGDPITMVNWLWVHIAIYWNRHRSCSCGHPE